MIARWRQGQKKSTNKAENKAELPTVPDYITVHDQTQKLIEKALKDTWTFPMNTETTSMPQTLYGMLEKLRDEFPVFIQEWEVKDPETMKPMIVMRFNSLWDFPYVCVAKLVNYLKFYSKTELEQQIMLLLIEGLSLRNRSAMEIGEYAIA